METMLGAEYLRAAEVFGKLLEQVAKLHLSAIASKAI